MSASLIAQGEGRCDGAGRQRGHVSILVGACGTPRAGPQQGFARSARELRCERIGIADGQLAGEALAHVGGGGSVQETASREQRHLFRRPSVHGIGDREHDVGPEAPGDLRREAGRPRIFELADHRHLVRWAEVEIEGTQRVPESGRRAPHDVADEEQRRAAGALVTGVAGQATRGGAAPRPPPSSRSGPRCRRAPSAAAGATPPRRGSGRSPRARHRRSRRSTPPPASGPSRTTAARTSSRRA